ncbi:hypothetical protein [Methylibium sp.]|uniref:hypothetical protein n=1 Tax=Methylibium sp. TaxID=2067992 RepID=UPI003D09F2B1
MSARQPIYHFTSGSLNSDSNSRRWWPGHLTDTEGHTDGIVAQAATSTLDTTEGPAYVDTARLCRHRAETPEEAEAAYQRRRANVERMADDAISRRQVLIWAVVFALSLAASALWKAPWGYGWHL